MKYLFNSLSDLKLIMIFCSILFNKNFNSINLSFKNDKNTI